MNISIIFTSLLLIQTSFCMQLFLHPVSSVTSDGDLEDYEVVENTKCVPYIFNEKRFLQAHPSSQNLSSDNGSQRYMVLKNSEFNCEMKIDEYKNLWSIHIEDCEEQIIIQHFFPSLHDNREAQLKIFFPDFSWYEKNTHLKRNIDRELERRMLIPKITFGLIKDKVESNHFTNRDHDKFFIIYTFPHKINSTAPDFDWLFLIWGNHSYHLRSLINLPKTAFRDSTVIQPQQNTASDQPGWLATITGFLASTSQ